MLAEYETAKVRRETYTKTYRAAKTRTLAMGSESEISLCFLIAVGDKLYSNISEIKRRFNPISVSGI